MWSQIGGGEINNPSKCRKFQGRRIYIVPPKHRTLAPNQAKGVRGVFPERATPKLKLNRVKEGYEHHCIRIKAKGTKSDKSSPC